MSRGARVALLLLLVVAAALLGLRAWQSTARMTAAQGVCDAVSEQRFADAVSDSAELLGPDPVGLLAAECRCAALAATERLEQCLDELAPLALDPAAGGWLPEPALTRLLVGRLRDREPRQAAALARRGLERDPDDGLLLHLELGSRAAYEDVGSIAADLDRRIAAQPDNRHLRVLAGSWLDRQGRHADALAAWPATPPPDVEGSQAWLRERLRIAAGVPVPVAEVQSTRDAWVAAGGNPAFARAAYAYALSVSSLEDPAVSRADLLGASASEAEAIGDEVLAELVWERWVGQLVVDGRLDDAVEALRLGKQRYELPHLSESELRRQRARLRSGGDGTVEIRFTVAGHGPRDRLWIAPPDGSAALDDPWTELPIDAAGVAVLRRPEQGVPTRWVLRGPDGSRASGSAWGIPGDVELVAVSAGAPAPDAPAFVSSRAAADGPRPVFVVVLDCFDWRIAQHQRMRGELPAFGSLLARGHRAVLDSQPPFTAAAMTALVHPVGRDRGSTLEVLHELGVELSDRLAANRNPVGALAYLLPEAADLFGRIGGTDKVATNLLFSHGFIDAGRQGEVIGPHGQRQPPAYAAAFRPLTAEDRARQPELAEMTPQDRAHFQEAAALMDAAEAQAASGETDLLMLRVASVDLATHSHYAATASGMQDDAGGLLYGLYRYLDLRVGELDAALDADDVLIVMSDHGIRTSMEHDPAAVFVAAGGGIPAGRAPGTPALRGVARYVADLLEVPTEWPDTGVGVSDR